MERAGRTVFFDKDLTMEAYSLHGVFDSFPSHVHDHYVIGTVLEGERVLVSDNHEHVLKKGDVFIFCPGISHSCSSADDKTFSFLSLNIANPVMLSFVIETGYGAVLPDFPRTVIRDECLSRELEALIGLILNQSSAIYKKERLLSMSSCLFKYSHMQIEERNPSREEIEKASLFMRMHFREHLSLEDIASPLGISKSTLIRAFSREKGLTPYLFLESVRIESAKALLEKGVFPSSVALDVGFSDQSHFSKAFKRLTGVTPGMYHDVFCHKEKTDGE